MSSWQFGRVTEEAHFPDSPESTSAADPGRGKQVHLTTEQHSIAGDHEPE